MHTHLPNSLGTQKTFSKCIASAAVFFIALHQFRRLVNLRVLLRRKSVVRAMGAIAADPVTIRYTEDDLYDYPVCFLCVQWSPFLIYLEDNPQVKKYRPLRNGMQLYCPMCVPEPGHFRERFPGEKIFRDESILNDQQLMRLLAEFRYDHPRKDDLTQLDRIIITERARLRTPYKRLAKKALPKKRKLELFMEMFPVVHRMANRRFPSYRAMRSAVVEKVAEINESYMNMSEQEHSELLDSIDVMVNRTPMHTRVVNQQQQQERALMPPPMPPVVEEVGANVTVSSLDSSINSEASTSGDVLRFNPSSDDDISISQDTPDSLSSVNASGIVLPSQSIARSSQSDLQLSSQDVSGPLSNLLAVNTQELQPRPTLDSSIKAPSLSSSSSSSSSSNVSLASTTAGQTSSPTSVATTRRKRSLESSSSSAASLCVPLTSPPTTTANDDHQEAGPSSKRPRSVLPMNPTPADFVRNPGSRMPRMKGA